MVSSVSMLSQRQAITGPSYCCALGCEHSSVPVFPVTGDYEAEAVIQNT